MVLDPAAARLDAPATAGRTGVPAITGSITTITTTATTARVRSVVFA